MMSQEAPYFAPEIIRKKREGEVLSSSELKWFIEGVLAGKIPDYQMSALLMAIYFQGMITAETAALTDVMLYSGEVLKFKGRNVIDKHSTGGVGDKTSFILAPLAAACGVKVPMIAGRGLGHTGGTIDKVEAIKGFKTSLTLAQFKKLLEKNGQVLIGQTPEIAPADKKLYALRDVTATVESIPLITASIMSKKLAEGAHGIVMDVKTGSGAFMKKKSDAKALAKSLALTANRFNRDMMTVISDMSQPLGFAIGNSIEIIESIETLKGRGPKDLTKLSLHLAGGMIFLAGKAKTHQEGIKQAKLALSDGRALKKFSELIAAQGGDARVVDDYSRLPVAKSKTLIVATGNGYLCETDCRAFGMAVTALGGGRTKTADKIDFAVGINFHTKIGDTIKKGQVLGEILHHKEQKKRASRLAAELIKNAIVIKGTKPKTLPKLISETRVSWGK